MHIKKIYFRILSVLIVLFLYTGCEAFFKYSPVAFLQRNPDNYTTAQKTEYFTDLTMGEEITEDALTDLGEFAEQNSADPEINKLAGNAFIEASGIDTVLESMVTDLTAGSGIEESSLLTAFVPEEGGSIGESIVAAFVEIEVDVDKFTDGAVFLAAAESNGAELSEADYLIGGVGLALNATNQVENLAAEDKQELQTALEEAGSFDALVEQAQSGELEDEQRDLVIQVDKAQDFLTEGFSAIQAAMGSGGESTEGQGEGESEGGDSGESEIPEDVELPAGLDVTELFSQLLGAGI